MKQLILFLYVLCAFASYTTAQKPTKQPSPAEIDKMMNDAMKGMSKEDAALMKEMMKQQQGKPAAQQPNSQ
jgi:NADP-dependent 3-hydroxy acid dehydrogenase YdfG